MTRRVFAEALGSMKGPVMKVAQLLATIPDALPADYSEHLMKLQSQAPPMGAAFVKRRMQAELGPDGAGASANSRWSPPPPPRSARCIAPRLSTASRSPASCNIPTWRRRWRPTSSSSICCSRSVAAWGRRSTRAKCPTRSATACARSSITQREMKLAALYRTMLADTPQVRVPRVLDPLVVQAPAHPAMARRREAARTSKRPPQNRATQSPWPCSTPGGGRSSHFEIIHGDPHLGNYSVVASGPGAARRSRRVNLFDFGCVRIFPAGFVGGVVELYQGLKAGDDARVVHAYEIWGFKRLSRETIAALNIWARFIYGPLIEDRVRTIADGVKPGQYGRREAFAVARALKAQGPLKVPREFVFMDRAAIGLGGAFLRLRAELNFHRLFEEAIGGFKIEDVAARQGEALAAVGLEAE